MASSGDGGRREKSGGEGVGDENNRRALVTHGGDVRTSCGFRVPFPLVQRTSTICDCIFKYNGCTFSLEIAINTRALPHI